MRLFEDASTILINLNSEHIPHELTNSGVRFYAGSDLLLPKHSVVNLKTGVMLSIPHGMEGILTISTELASNNIILANLIGTIDEDYRGEIGILLANISDEDVSVKYGTHIADLAIKNYHRQNNSIEIIVHNDLCRPSYATDGASCMDLYACIENTITIPPRSVSVVPTGLDIFIPEDYEAQIRPRSGLALKHQVAASVMTLNSGWHTNICVYMINIMDKPFTIEPKTRIAQIGFYQKPKIRFQLVDKLDQTERNTGGFGSTGY